MLSADDVAKEFIKQDLCLSEFFETKYPDLPQDFKEEVARIIMSRKYG